MDPINTPAVESEGAEDTSTGTEEAIEDIVGTPEPETFTLEDLLGAELDDPLMQGEHKGLPHYNEVLRAIPEDGRKLIQNFRAGLTRKQQEYASLKQELEAERAELSRQRELLSNSPAAKAIQAQATKAMPEGVDPWSEEGLAAMIEQKAAEMMQKVLAPMQEEQAVSVRKAELGAFKAEHPDLVDDPGTKSEVVALLKANPSMKLETAYWAVKGRQGANRAATEREAASQVKATARKSLLKTSTGTRVVGGVRQPKFRDAWESFQWHKAQKG